MGYYCCGTGACLPACLLTHAGYNKDDYLHGITTNPHLSSDRSSHEIRKCGCEVVQLCDVQLAMLLTLIGPIWIYHVVSPAIGAMHSPAAGFMSATPQTISAVTAIYFVKSVTHTKHTTLFRGVSGEDRRDDARINEWEY